MITETLRDLGLKLTDISFEMIDGKLSQKASSGILLEYDLSTSISEGTFLAEASVRQCPDVSLTIVSTVPGFQLKLRKSHRCMNIHFEIPTLMRPTCTCQAITGLPLIDQWSGGRSSLPAIVLTISSI